MNRLRQYTALFVVFYCIRAFAADGDFYRLFQSAVTNYYRPLHNAATNGQSIEIDSPLLVDTNNTGFKLTNAVLHLEALTANGEPSGIRLGMSMEEVVARWGKPIGIDPQCLGYPHFIYTEAHVYFEAASNSVKAIHGDVPDLARTLGTWPTTEDCIREIGAPSQRQYYAGGTHCYLIYEKPKGRIRLLCVSGKLTSIEWGPDLRK
jgi:hypothetical protein